MVAHGNSLEMLGEVAARLPASSAIRARVSSAAEDTQIGVHLAVFVEPFLSAVLDGQKTIESRFAKTRCAPFNKIAAGDLILLKRSGGPVVGVALAGRAEFRELDEEQLQDIRNRYSESLYAVDDAFWEERADKRYATLIELEEPTAISSMPVAKRDRRGWVTIRS